MHNDQDLVNTPRRLKFEI
uniref:Uncharacterized protein n=1 Tax=Arundo donax TaxID=35708 RepID=A0A0A9BKZ9_ARUDO